MNLKQLFLQLCLLKGFYIKIIKNPSWLVGFINGEGSFIIKVINSSGHHLKTQVRLVFELSQKVRYEQLMRNLIKYFDDRAIYKHSNNAFVFIIK